MLSEIGFTQIRDSFYYGYYGQFRVVVDKQDGYVNATKLCSDGGKNFFHWKETKVSKELLSTLQQYKFQQAIDLDETQEPWSLSSYSPVNEVVRLVQTSNVNDTERSISGTYVHPLLVPHIACWVSPSFALKAASIINFFLVEEWRAKLLASNQATTELQSNLQAREQQVELLENNVNGWRTVSNLQNTVINIKQEMVNTLEEKVVEKAREHQVWASTHTFTMLKTNDEESKHGYYVIRCQSRGVGAAIRKMRQKHAGAEVIYQQKRVPNAVNLYTRLKAQRVVQHKQNYCSPICSEEQLLYHLNSLCGTNYPASNPAPLNSHLSE
jgi:KilA-N domain/Protein of unknown function (DUF3627)